MNPCATVRASLPAVFVLLLWSCAALAQSAPPAASLPPASPSLQSQPAAPLHREETVVVTGSYQPAPLEESDRAVSVIETGETISTYRNWAEALDNDSSVDVEQRAPGISADLSIRGSSYGQTLILVDGLRMNDPQTGHGDFDIPFPFESIARIEVMKGAGSTLYGANAMGGAVNFITRPPVKSAARFGTAFGNWGTNQQSGAVSLVGKSGDEELSFTREFSTGFMADRDYRSLALASESGFTTKLGRSDVLLGLSDRPFGAAGSYGVPAGYGSWERTKGWLAAWSQPMGTQTSASVAYRRHSDVYIYVKSDPALYENNHVAEDYQATLRRFEKIGPAMRVYYGADAIREHIDSNNLGIHTRDQTGFYASFDARTLRRFSLTAGVREELYTGGQNVFSPSLSGAAWINSKVKLRGSASHGFRLADFTQLYYKDPMHLPNPKLKAEQSWSFEGEAQMALGHDVTLDATVFHHRDRDVIDYVRPLGSTAAYQAENIQRLNFTGAEFALRWQVAREQRIEVSYTMTHGSKPAVKNEEFLYAYNFPTHRAVVSWTGRLPGRVDSRVRVTTVQRYGQDVYGLLDCTVGRQFAHWKPYAQLTNLANTSYAELQGVRMPGRGVLGGVEMSWQAK